MPAASAISRMPASRPAGSRGSPHGQHHRRPERVPPQQPGLIDRPAERGPEARNRPARRREHREPAEQGFVLVERDVVEEGVAAVEEPRDAAGLDVPRHAFRRVEVERALGVALARKRRDGEDAGEVVDRDRAHGGNIVSRVIQGARSAFISLRRGDPTPATPRGAPPPRAASASLRSAPLVSGP